LQYSIEYISDEDIIDVKLTGRINYQVIEQSLTEAVKSARQNSCSKFIIDHRSTEIENNGYRLHSSGEELQQFGFLNSDKIAIVVSQSYKNIKIPESVKGNARWSEVKYFDKDNIEKAKSWLSSGTEN
jgi:hypothetical protein